MTSSHHTSGGISFFQFIFHVFISYCIQPLFYSSHFTLQSVYNIIIYPSSFPFLFLKCIVPLLHLLTHSSSQFPQLFPLASAFSTHFKLHIVHIQLNSPSVSLPTIQYTSTTANPYPITRSSSQSPNFFLLLPSPTSLLLLLHQILLFFFLHSSIF